MRSRVELIYDQACPNVEQSRAALLKAFAQVGLAPAWKEWDSRSSDSPAYARSFGSPTILVDGNDVVGHTPSDDPECCRVYDNTAGGSVRGVPPIHAIAEALKVHASQDAAGPADGGQGRHWSRPFAAVPGVGAALLPVGICPACWPAYAGLLSSLGLGFLLETTYLLPLTGALFLFALVSLAYKARSRRGYGPLGVGVAATTMALLGKFAVSSNLLLYLGLALLVGASLWHAWPRKTATGSCPQCASQVSVSSEHAHSEES